MTRNSDRLIEFDGAGSPIGRSPFRPILGGAVKTSNFMLARLTTSHGRPGRRRRARRLGLEGHDGAPTRPGMVGAGCRISAWTKVENSAIAVRSGFFVFLNAGRAPSTGPGSPSSVILRRQISSAAPFMRRLKPFHSVYQLRERFPLSH